MTQYVSYNTASGAITGMYDDAVRALPTPADAEAMLEVTAAQWAQIGPGWQVVNGIPIEGQITVTPIPLALQAQAALDAMDAPGGCAIRCFKSGQAFPADWQAYTVELRAIVNGTASPMPTSLPVQPAFPAGT
jgi:hypothetical protein